jgi:glycosyltransferase involved in cell wall biosynthesis
VLHESVSSILPNRKGLNRLSALLSINNYYYLRGGAEAVFLRHNSLFERWGWRVAPFAMQHPKNIDSPWSKYFVDEIEFGSAYSVRQKIMRVPKVIYSFEAQNNISALLDAFPADVCHAHNIYHHISPSILKVVKQRNIPVVMTLHDLKLACPAYNMLARDGVCERCKGGHIHNVLVRRCIKGSVALSAIIMAEALLHNAIQTFEKYVDRFVVPSRFYIKKLMEWGWSEERFVYIPNTVNTDEFRAEYKPGKSFVYFGRLSREKGLSTLIKAAAVADVPIKIIGTGNEEASLRELARALGSDVSFLGYLSGDALHDAIRSSRAVILPSEWYENAPLSIMEAYALGKPVIGADIGGIPELIRADETGCVFKSGSIEDLSTMLVNFDHMSDAQIADMGRNGRAWMTTEFGVEQYVSKTLELYGKLGVR